MRGLSENYLTFGGTDAIASVVFPDAKPIVMGKLRGISYSTMRPLIPVPVLGKRRMGGFAKGARAVAGTLIFSASWNAHWVRDLAREVWYLRNLPALKPDSLPPFDIIVTVANEYGASGGYAIYGVRTTDEAQVISEEDPLTENVVTFEANDFYPMNDLRGFYEDKADVSSHEEFSYFHIAEVSW